MPLTQLSLDTEYRSVPSDLATTFYRWCLEQSVRYDRAGCLSSMASVVAGSRMVEFARRGGRIRLLCSPSLSEADIDAVTKQSAQLSDIAAKRLVEEIEALSGPKSADFAISTLATLIVRGAMDIRIAVRTNGYGTLHETLGVFEDQDGNTVSFIGSADETWMASRPDGGHEAIEVFSSWSSDGIRVARHRSHFSRIWEGRDPSLIVLDFPPAVRARLGVYAAPSLEDLNPPDQHLIPARPLPRPHQTAALNAWAANGHRGILKHATGSGKTLTALFAMESHLGSGGVVLILVPSQILLEQWHTEIVRFFGNVDTMLAGAGNNDWRERGMLRSFTSPDRLLGGRIVLATMQTARTDDFLIRLRQGSHVFLVADEVHQLGSTENLRALQLDASWRLGLSATPERYHDPDGTSRLIRYFGGVIQPEYTLADAIDDKNLVPYEYHPQVITLSPEEADEWRKQSHEISVAVAKGQSSDTTVAGEPSDLVKRLLIRRARIAKKASGKQRVCQEILKKEYRSGQRWLVYCEDVEQLRAIVQETRAWLPDTIEYHSAIPADTRAATLQWFQEEGGILVAIACLDEGVNIPSISHALVLASSQNPRQFIQRRGRILRRFPGKRIASIFDVLVSPENVDDEPTQQSLLKSELRRALEFSQLAANGSATAALRLIAARSGIDPNSIADFGSENDDRRNGGFGYE